MQAWPADTEGSFMLERVAQIADACIKHLKRIALASNNATQAEAVRTTAHSTSLPPVAQGAVELHMCCH